MHGKLDEINWAIKSFYAERLANFSLIEAISQASAFPASLSAKKLCTTDWLLLNNEMAIYWIKFASYYLPNICFLLSSYYLLIIFLLSVSFYLPTICFLLSSYNLFLIIFLLSVSHYWIVASHHHRLCCYLDGVQPIIPNFIHYSIRTDI